MNIRTINTNKSEYPTILNKCVVDAPRVLYRLGEPIKLKFPTIAVVGSRKPTSYGRTVASKLVGELASRNVGIVSGLALGIDGIAHQAALDAGGYTLAVMPAGLDNIYPASHRNLAKAILKNKGTLISEYDIGTSATRYNFPARNRLISGLSDGVLIIEAAQKSGTLITAEHALDQGKIVMAVPGNITSELSRGTNRLLQMGAQLITSVEDIFYALGLEIALPKQSELYLDNDTETKIVKALRGSTKTPNQLAALLDIELAELNQHLTHLELSGHVQNIGANQWITMS